MRLLRLEVRTVMIKFKIFNIPLVILPSFWIFILFFISGTSVNVTNLLLYGIVMTISLFVHELGHGLLAKFFGKSPSITFKAFGGDTSFSSVGLTTTQRFFITLAGPLLESFLILIPYLLLQSQLMLPSLVEQVLYITMRLNIIWVLFNLIPIEPLDGGKLFNYFVYRYFKKQAPKISFFISSLFAVVGCAYFFSQQMYFFSLFLFFIGLQNMQRQSLIVKQPEDFDPYPSYQQCIEALRNNEKEKAKKILKNLLKLKPHRLTIPALETLAELYFAENQFKKAYALLSSTNLTLLRKGKPLLCKLAFREKNYEFVAKLSREIYEIEPTQEIALLNAKTFAKLNNPKLALGWLKTSAQFKTAEKKSLEEILEDKMFQQLKKDPNYSENVKSIFDLFAPKE